MALVTFALPWPRLRVLPSLPPTVRDLEVAPLFRERFILSGYRPAAQPWRRYALGLLQVHNQTINAWSHLLAAACMAARFTLFGVLQGGVLTRSGPVCCPVTVGVVFDL